MASVAILLGQFVLWSTLGTFASFLATLGGFGMGLSRLIFLCFFLFQVVGWLGDEPIAIALKWKVDAWYLFLVIALVAVGLGVIVWRVL